MFTAVIAWGGSSLRPLVTIFVLVGLVHVALVWRFGVPAVEPPAPAMFWFFLGLCWLVVNSAVTVAIYAAYVFAFELEPAEFVEWLKRGGRILQAMAWGTELPSPRVKPKSSSTRS